jgi:hypothetical protein
VTTGARPIPVRVVPRKGPDTWHEVAEEELNRPFAAGENPLWQAVLVRGDGDDEEAELLLRVHHVLADATSAALCVREILADAAALLAGGPLPKVESLPLRPALSELIPVGGPRMLTYMNSFLWRHLATKLRRPRKLRCDDIAVPGHRRSRFLHYRLSGEGTGALLLRCKQEKTTVHGALGAALLLALAADLDQGPALTVPPPRPSEKKEPEGYCLGCFSAVSLRDRLRVPLDGQVGLFASQATTIHTMHSGGPAKERDLWDLAREFRTRLREVIERGEPYMTFPSLGMFIPRGPDPLPGLVKRLDLGGPFTTGITNVGRLPGPARYGPLLLVGLHLAIGVAMIAPIVAAVTTLSPDAQGGPAASPGEQLTCNLLYVEPLISRERAQAIGERWLGLLSPGARGPSRRVGSG